MSTTYTSPSAPSLRLGLRARWRAMREARMTSASARRHLAERLRSPRPVDPDGVILAHALLVDGSGPLYVPQEPGELRAAALRALDALDGRRGAR
jgi:hypothetical protein